MVCPEGNIDYLQIVSLWSMYCQCAPHIKASLFPYDCITRCLQSCAPMDRIHVFDFALPWFCEHTDGEILILMLIEMVYFNNLVTVAKKIHQTVVKFPTANVWAQYILEILSLYPKQWLRLFTKLTPKQQTSMLLTVPTVGCRRASAIKTK